MSTTTTTQKVNPFATAKKKEPAGKKSEVDVVKIPGLSTELNRFSEAKAQIKIFEAQKKAAEAVIKERGAEAWLERVMRTRKKVSSFNVVDDGAQPVLFGVKDQYNTKLTEEQAEKIDAAFGGNVIRRHKTYTFNTEILEEYMDEIQDALMNAEIPDDAKANLLTITEGFTAKKGTIERIPHMENGADLFYAVEPQLFLK